ncbi:hypothetical protein PC9H_002294 [Pleurotus ostreatus]|uniref:F-box domain-containing protein n=1 Tax=Pleurotus ostreatus TaxID=5322 RepID=A0A8H6ZLC7_PLEOS|nr:uncharacterized protein PC9H_002294 [Pleurotus ostreatus]KAF7419702.1 hypothetical protein PC9H_002294 [Pleurotus ostreatus]KAJ8689420.1 hypothetical protein PTI98_012323 [Pleurotus ostreatus]
MKTIPRNICSAEELPIELIHHIVSCLEDSDNEEKFCYREHVPPDLNALSLVCRSWNEVCRHHIFRTIGVNYGHDSFTSRLSFLHFTAPHLYKYILRLDVCLDTGYDSVAEWVPECFARFTNLRALRLNARFISGAILDVLPGFGIVSLLASVRLQELVLASWDVDAEASDLLPILSTCSPSLESLSLEMYGIYTPERPETTSCISGAPSPRSVCLDALRSLKVVQNVAVLPHTDRIKCPNLEYVEIVQLTSGYWNIPRWIPANLSELILSVSPTAIIPDIGAAICPSALTINILCPSEAPRLSSIAWIGDCINRLPFPNRLRGVAIHIDPLGWGGQSYPEPIHYEALHRIIQPLHDHGALKKISISIGDVNDDSIETDCDEVAVFEEAFAPLIEGITAAGGFRRITCKYGGIDVLMSHEAL